MLNTIILKRGYARLTGKAYKNFSKGDTIWGVNEDPEELKRWSIEDKEQALEALGKVKCSYHKGPELWYIEEYALEYCRCDEDGEFIEDSDYELAEEE